MTEYTWTFPQIEVALAEDGLTNVAKVVHWRLDGIDDGHSAGAYGTAALSPPDAADFVAYEDLTKDKVIEWVTGALGGDEKIAEIKAAIEGQIAKLKNPPVVTLTPPWA